MFPPCFNLSRDPRAVTGHHPGPMDALSTCRLLAGGTVPSDPVVGHAGHATHGLRGPPAAVAAALLRLAAEAALGDGRPAATVASLPALEAVKAPVVSVPLPAAVTAGARPEEHTNKQGLWSTQDDRDRGPKAGLGD